LALDLWFREDIARILASTGETMSAGQTAVPALDQDLADSYRHGFCDALHALAVAFGVASPIPAVYGGTLHEPDAIQPTQDAGELARPRKPVL
jgi:hypothetical protein